MLSTTTTYNLVRYLSWLTVGLLLSAGASAADFGARLGYGFWNQSFSGEINSTDVEIGQINIKDDLGFDSESADSFYLVLEHPLGVVPNVKVLHTELESDANSTLNRSITYDEVTFAADRMIFAGMDLSHDDVSLYWQPIQDRFALGLGVTIRILDGSFSIVDLEDSSRAIQLVDEAFPLPYAQFSYDFGNTGVSIGGDLQFAAFEGDKFVDSHLRLAFLSKMGLGVELGYRSISLDVTDLEVDDDAGNPDEIDIDLRAEGFYIGAFYAF